MNEVGRLLENIGALPLMWRIPSPKFSRKKAFVLLIRSSEAISLFIVASQNKERRDTFLRRDQMTKIIQPKTAWRLWRINDVKLALKMGHSRPLFWFFVLVKQFDRIKTADSAGFELGSSETKENTLTI